MTAVDEQFTQVFSEWDLETLYADLDSVKGEEVDLCSTLYQYVKSLVGKSNGKVDNWRNITEWLEGAGYRKQIPVEVKADDQFSVKILVKKANIVLEKNQIAIDINLRIIAPTSPEITLVDEEIEVVETNPSVSLN